jgi:hypothetical protein
VGLGFQHVLIHAYERATTALCESSAQTTVADILAHADNGARVEFQHAQ